LPAQLRENGGFATVPVLRRPGAGGIDSCVDQFPSGLLSGEGLDQDCSDECGVWWLAHTRPRQEKAAASALLSRSVGYYLPLVTRKSLLRGRTRLARIPLFPGYVFIFGTDENRLSALKTNRLLTIDKVPDGASLRRQLATFAELIAAGAPLVREARLVAGERVRIKSGLFQGVEGIILRRNGKTELLIAIDFLGQGASIEIEDCNAEPV
jgi:transcriptional antiterminator RfaH